MTYDYLLVENTLLRTELEAQRVKLTNKYATALSQKDRQNDYMMFELMKAKEEIETLRNLIWQYQTGGYKRRKIVLD